MCPNFLKHVQVPWQAIEEAFWSIVEEGEEEVEVLYGADLDSTIFGSAFPTKSGRMADSEYADVPWNLNNIPRLSGDLPELDNPTIIALLSQLHQ